MDKFSGFTSIHQPRRDLYGGAVTKGIPTGLQHILYGVSNAVIKSYNYDETRSKSQVDKAQIYSIVADHLQSELDRRSSCHTHHTKGTFHYYRRLLTVPSTTPHPPPPPHHPTSPPPPLPWGIYWCFEHHRPPPLTCEIHRCFDA